MCDTHSFLLPEVRAYQWCQSGGEDWELLPRARSNQYPPACSDLVPMWMLNRGTTSVASLEHSSCKGRQRTHRLSPPRAHGAESRACRWRARLTVACCLWEELGVPYWWAWREHWRPGRRDPSRKHPRKPFDFHRHWWGRESYQWTSCRSHFETKERSWRRWRDGLRHSGEEWRCLDLGLPDRSRE